MNVQHSTSFFLRQAQARKNSRNLLILFVLAVLLIGFTATLVVRFVWFLFLSSQAITSLSTSDSHYYWGHIRTFTFFDAPSFILAGIIVIIVIAVASWMKMQEMKKGGGAIAEMLGGQLISGQTSDPAERRLQNVVEEMAIASGIPVPLVFVLDDENAINAFAAGLELQDSAVAVTRGALTKLNRDELQGVIGHEFSHILNGDTRLNSQLIGTLYGILFLGIIGGEIISQRRIASKAGFVIITAGVLLAGVGYVGSFMGRMIQCAVSRQQELLADASAVQFTRNPLGLAGALKKIGGYATSSRIHSIKARQARHLFFAESHDDFFFADFLATHPPLSYRIRLLDPSFDGKFATMDENRVTPEIDTKYTTPYGLNKPAVFFAAAPVPLQSGAVTSQVGLLTHEHLIQSTAMISSIPEEIKLFLNTPQGAASVVCALLLGEDPHEREMQISRLPVTLALQGQTSNVQQIARFLSPLAANLKLPILEMALPSIRSLTGLEKRNLLLIINSLITADGKVTLFELTLQWILNKYLNDSDDLFSSSNIFTYTAVGLDILVILKALACSERDCNEAKAASAFQAGMARIPELAAKNPGFFYEQNISFDRVNSALQKLSTASFKIKESVIDACAHCAFADQTITVTEAELLRVISLALNCPLPPFAGAQADQAIA